MTNKEDGEATCDRNPGRAALLAVHLVSQILDEAYVIANAAKESGQPWRNLSMLKSFKLGRLGETDEDSFEASKGDCDLNENKAEIVATVVATSTPQKNASRGSCSGDVYIEVEPGHDWHRTEEDGMKKESPIPSSGIRMAVDEYCKREFYDVNVSSIHHNDNPFIGQGDEGIETQQIELAKSTSMFINHLFDMSDVERVVICDNTEVMQSTSEPNEVIAETVHQMLGAYVDDDVIPLEAFSFVPNVEIIDGIPSEEYSRSGNSEYFMPEVFIADIHRDVSFYIDGDNSREKNDDIGIEVYESAVVEEIIETNFKEEPEEEDSGKIIQENDVALYENAYATLNRDYEQGSEEESFPILQDPKGMTLQEVELITADTSDEEPDENQKVQVPNDEIPTTVSGTSGSRKSSVARRCRIQGARLLACLRGWWKRKTPGKRKEARCSATVLGMCPLSPDARRRASSLLDHRLLRSPSPSRPVIWKFNTVNEILVNSNRWKEYTFDPKTEDCGETSGY